MEAWYLSDNRYHCKPFRMSFRDMFGFSVGEEKCIVVSEKVPDHSKAGVSEIQSMGQC